MKLHIIRGLPGSGKSTYAKKLLGIHCEADQFFEVHTSYSLTPVDYKWSPDFLHEAHQLCKLRAIRALYHGHDVVVANTFTTLKELQPYLDLKQRFPDLEITVHELHTQYESIHNVPDRTIERMKQRWQEIPNDWSIKVIKIKE